MNDQLDWKIKEAILKLKNNYDFIGHKTGAPFLGIVYNHSEEQWFYKEWDAQVQSIANEFVFFDIDFLKLIHNCISNLGINEAIDAINNPMRGNSPYNGLAELFIDDTIEIIKEKLSNPSNKKPILVLKKLDALFPVTTPHTLFQNLWDIHGNILKCPVVCLIPGKNSNGRSYLFLNEIQELMYRGDLL